ncbi:MAG: Clp protease ClpP [Caulobacteraceae bacterium]|nr:Clp protease ClpP [Caulobacteraceae bacterium]
MIGADWTGEGITAAAVGDSLKAIKGRAVVRINSPGGSADEGVAIYNLLKRHAGGVDTHNEALAASAASIIFLAGDKRTMERGSKLMIHRAHTIAIGNSVDMTKMSEVLAMYDTQMADLYAEYMAIDSTEVLSMMTDETWFDAADAVASGLATDLSPTVRRKAAAAAAWLKHPPQDLFAEAAEQEAAAITKSAYSQRKERETRLRLYPR